MLLSHKDKSPLTEDEGAIAYFGFPSYGYLLGEWTFEKQSFL
jgi:hypothetical protein